MVFCMQKTHRKLPKVDEVLETKAFSGVEFRGKIPIMAYKDTDIDNIVEAMQTRFQLDDITSPIVQATKVLNLSKWPMISNEKEKLAGYDMLPWFSCVKFELFFVPGIS
ncbi:hypothetical protein DPMN_147757 [Dreissena polymorpha]|uniref:Uncharacterized protein n=1 Tax=Dreissena polymorpha TaxID=45954 RepID=A0A9D4IZL3_DREPO|nr:hypothetical protein DPMN_147757 [Dreissena polymorpha]